MTYPLAPPCHATLDTRTRCPVTKGAAPHRPCREAARRRNRSPWRRTKLLLGVLCIATRGMASALAGAAEPATDPATTAAKPTADGARIYASVDGKPLTGDMLSLLSVWVMKKPLTALTPTEIRDGTEVLIDIAVAAAEAIRQNLAENPFAKPLDCLDVGHSTCEDLQHSFLLYQGLVAQFRVAHPVTEEDLKAAYAQRAQQWSIREYHARHILVHNQAEASAVIEKLHAGAKFEDLARTMSIDSSKAKGGDIGWYNPTQMLKPFQDAVDKLAKGEVTPVPVQTSFGFHVIQLLDTRLLPPPPYAQVKDRLLPVVEQQKLKEYFATLRKSAAVQLSH